MPNGDPAPPAASQPTVLFAAQAALPMVAVPVPNRCVLDLLARNRLRDPATASGRALFLQRLGLVVLAQHRATTGPWAAGAAWASAGGVGGGPGWLCTAAAGPLDCRAPVGVMWVGDVEIAAALEVRDPLHPLADLTPAEVCQAWRVRVWDRWPGGRIVQVAQALLELAEPGSLAGSLTVCTGPPHWPVIARRSGLPSTHGLARHLENLSAAGLLAPMFTDADADPDRRCRLTLPPAVTW
jgi:hypothetical protein